MEGHDQDQALVAWADRLVAPRALIFGILRFLGFLFLFTFLWMQGGMGAAIHNTLISSANSLLEAVESRRSHTVIRYEPDPSRPGQTRAVEYEARHKVRAKFNHRLTYTLGIALALCCFLPHRPWPRAVLAFCIVCISMLFLLFLASIAHAYHVLGVKLAGGGRHAASFTETSLLFGIAYIILPLLANAAGWWGAPWILARCKSNIPAEPADA